MLKPLAWSLTATIVSTAALGSVAPARAATPIFGDDFAPGNTCRWSAHAPADACDDMVLVPAGTFTMGSNDGEDEEKPVHAVELDAFWIDRTEVTNGAYYDCWANSGCPEPPDWAPSRECTWWGPGGRTTQPANCLDWDHARAYCAWAGKRLPTEAEWEKAARGTDARTYPWGEAIATCSYSVMYDPAAGGTGCGVAHTAPVASKPTGVSPFGAFDMAGNVREWVADWYGANTYATAPFVNPTGPATGTFKILRGGSWNDIPTVSPAQPGSARPGAGSSYLPVRAIQWAQRCARDP
ncbi:MAG: SUMF1/EgtB/PvdO family nonheme iron enzyme [bacterium]